MAANRPHSHQTSLSLIRQPSWWMVVIAGSLLVFFLVATVRELVHGYTVRQQVAHLRQQVASEEKRQHDLKDLLDYLASPTFQERQARLNLGLKKSGERVVIVPPNTNSSESENIASPNETAHRPTGPGAWWGYFFSQPISST